MKKLILILLLSQPALAIAQAPLPDWFYKSFKANKLDQQYELSAFIKPTFLSDDFNGDGQIDIAALIVQKKTKKQGVIIIQGNTSKCYVIGAGINFGNGGDDFKWIKGWKLYKDKVAYETTFDKDDNISSSKKIKLKHNGFFVYDIEDGQPASGGIIYWDGKKYTWIHQGE